MSNLGKFQQREVDYFLKVEGRIYNEGCRTNDAPSEKIGAHRLDQFQLDGYKINFFRIEFQDKRQNSLHSAKRSFLWIK